MKPAGILILLFAAISGCANLNTISRSTPLPEAGIAIHLDASQRLVYADSKGNICAEPTPDALQSYASALGAGGSISDKGAASVSSAISANAASVGLHTQSITLMRETLYRICEYSHNHNAAPLQVVQLLQRSQDLTLGVLAIEQLTGAVVARQVALTSGSSANSAASINDTQSQLDVAQKNEAAKKAALASAQNAASAAQAKADAIQAQLTGETGKANADQDAAKIDSLKQQNADQQSALVSANAALTSAQLDYKQAVAETTTIQSLLGAAMSSALASTNGTAAFSAAESSKTIDQNTAEKIANAAVSIVDKILSKGHLTDTCMSFLTSVLSTKQQDPAVAASISNVVDKCNAVIATDLQIAANLGQQPLRTQTATGANAPFELKATVDLGDAWRDRPKDPAPTAKKKSPPKAKQ